MKGIPWEFVDHAVIEMGGTRWVREEDYERLQDRIRDLEESRAYYRGLASAGGPVVEEGVKRGDSNADTNG